MSDQEGTPSPPAMRPSEILAQSPSADRRYQNVKAGSDRDEPRGALAVALREAQASRNLDLLRRQDTAAKAFIDKHPMLAQQQSNQIVLSDRAGAHTRANATGS